MQGSAGRDKNHAKRHPILNPKVGKVHKRRIRTKPMGHFISVLHIISSGKDHRTPRIAAIITRPTLQTVSGYR